jgi:hypothetical protein
MKRAPQYRYIGCNPFSGRLTHSTRQMREHKTVSPNYRRLSTSTIVFFVWRKDLREMMLRLDDVFVFVMSNLVELFGCAFAFLGEKKKKWLFRPLSRCFVVLDGCDFGVVCYCCLNRMIGLATVISVEDVQSDLGQSDQAVIQNCCVCAALKCSMFDGGWTLFAQLLQSAFPFYCWNSNKWKD